MKLKTLRAILFVSLLSLAGCSWLGWGGDDSKNNDDDDQKRTADLAKIKPVTPICPQVAIVRELMQVSDFGREKATPENLVSAARMDSVAGDCAYRDDGIDIAFDLNFVALRGPGLGGLHTSFPYFVAVVDPSQTVLNKNQMTVEFGFSSDEKTSNRAESLHIFIPLAKDRQKSGPDYQVLAGFQLTKEQMESANINGNAQDK